MAFYITTPIYYVNDKPHIGHAYTTIVADILSRYHRLFKEKVFFLTGTDEHGQKVEKAAKQKGIDPQLYVDQYSENFKETWKDLNISYDFFIRTTMKFHQEIVQQCLQYLFDKGEIYEDYYQGWYSESEEMFYTEKDLINGKSPLGKEVVKIKEKNYFFKMSKYQERLRDHIINNNKFIQPEGKRKEVLGFLKQPLNDLCISRPKKRLSWGIELPFDKDYVTYVWFDALLNYISGIGYNKDNTLFNTFWPNAIHLIGKDILTTHAVYWPTMLMALDIPLPKTIFAHGWWLNKEGGKMSKSEGSVISPLDVKDIIGLDQFRYFLAREVQLGNDAGFSLEITINRINAELSNNLGNLYSRALTLLAKNYKTMPAPTTHLSETKLLIDSALSLPQKIKERINNFELNLAIGELINILNDVNKYLDEIEPWKLIKKEQHQEAQESLYTACEIIRFVAILLSPVMPIKSKEILQGLGLSEDACQIETLKEWGQLKEGALLNKPKPIFPRIEYER